MNELTSKQRSFVELMQKSVDHARRGFDLLTSRSDAAIYFEHLHAAGLLSAENNPRPYSAKEEGYSHVPQWPALAYLVEVAKAANRNADDHLARGVMSVVREVTNAPDYLDPGQLSKKDNYHTWWRFAEVVGALPTSAVSLADVGMIETWLSSRFDSGTVAHELDKGLLTRLLAGDSDDLCEKAVGVLRFCTALRKSGVGPVNKRGGAKSVVDEHWLGEMLKHQARPFGAKCKQNAADLIMSRLRELFSSSGGELSSSYARPAIEDHVQNRGHDDLTNSFVDAARDLLLGWHDADPATCSEYCERLLADHLEIARRLAVHVMHQTWPASKAVLLRNIGPRLLQASHLHEMYVLLQDHFEGLSPQEQRLVQDAIRKLDRNLRRPDTKRRARRLQLTWLSAIRSRGSKDPDAFFEKLAADPDVGPLSEHPEFHFYMESWSGPGPSAFSPAELTSFAAAGSLVSKLNSFQEIDRWRGPTTAALVEALKEAVAASPEIFAAAANEILKVKRPYQYGWIAGMKSAWTSETAKSAPSAWETHWQSLFAFFESLLLREEFWTEPTVKAEGLTPTKDWILPIVSEFVDAGAKADDHAFPAELMPRAWLLVQTIVDRIPATTAAAEDPMGLALNSTKGRALGALFSVALRACRLADKAVGNHRDAWQRVMPAFDTELHKTPNENFEFSTLCGAYLGQLEYMSSEWLGDNIDRIFAPQHESTFSSAVSGLAHASATASIYRLLVDHGVIDAGLRQDIKRVQARERLIERVALAYLWGIETLDSPRCTYLLDPARVADLETIAAFLWSVRGQSLSNGQRQLVIDFWERCNDLVKLAPENACRELLSKLSRLASFLRVLDDKEVALLLAVAPYAHVGYNTDDFAEQLQRIVAINADVATAALEKMLEAEIPSFDFEDRLKSLLREVARRGRKKEAIRLVQMLSRLPGMVELYNELAGRGKRAT